MSRPGSRGKGLELRIRVQQTRLKGRVYLNDAKISTRGCAFQMGIHLAHIMSQNKKVRGILTRAMIRHMATHPDDRDVIHILATMQTMSPPRS